MPDSAQGGPTSTYVSAKILPIKADPAERGATQKTKRDVDADAIAAVAERKEFGRYKIAGVLGTGAMGLVYDGLDPRLSRRVAIKTILKSNLEPCSTDA